MTVLLTGFGRYGREESNPTSQLAKIPHGRKVGKHEIVGKELRVSTRDVLKRLPALIDSMRPILALGLGLAPRRVHITPERVAVNCCDFSIPDAAGYRPIDKPIDPQRARSAKDVTAEKLNLAQISAEDQYQVLNLLQEYIAESQGQLSYRTRKNRYVAARAREQVPRISLDCMKDAVLTAIMVSLGPI